MKIIDRVKLLERNINAKEQQLLILGEVTSEGKICVINPCPVREMTPQQVADWRGTVIFFDEGDKARELLPPEMPRKHGEELAIRDDGSIERRCFNGYVPKDGSLF